MDAVDNYLIDRFEWISDQISQLLGINNFSLSRICAFALTAISFASSTGIISNLFVSVAFVFLFAGSFGIENIMRSRNQDVAVANPLKLGHKHIRKILIMISLLYVISPRSSVIGYLFSILSQLFLVIHFYFICCDVKPPTKSWLRKKIESLTPAPALVPVPVRGE